MYTKICLILIVFFIFYLLIKINIILKGITFSVVYSHSQTQVIQSLHRLGFWNYCIIRLSTHWYDKLYNMDWKHLFIFDNRVLLMFVLKKWVIQIKVSIFVMVMMLYVMKISAFLFTFLVCYQKDLKWA